MAAMPHHLSHLAAIDRPDSRVSLARSDTTYHSFQDIDLPEPEAPSGPAQQPAVRPPSPSPPPSPPAAGGAVVVSPCRANEGQPPAAPEMRRKDSGYESIAPLDSPPLPLCPERTSSPVSLSSSTRRRRTRPPHHHHRSSRSGPVSHSHRPRSSRHSVSSPCSSRSLSSPPPSQQQQQQPVTYFYFPDFTPSDPTLTEPAEQQPAVGSTSAALRQCQYEDPAYPPQPPQTTHYWTSDRTRRIEYAAIDAASKGVRGWVMRHVVPECFVPPSKRLIGFEDDRGSVVRYRLELEADEESADAEKSESARAKGWWKGWWFGFRRR
ncbi:uncharacterized protein P884DRAFT_197758 [Thermothelomyces heterothallicus CBS 202.75]|uniref:uncharacterized protein n=1 Tax=Thermothelomyces heterothallicus CBS 202.75 TaxID=1149848 RepID=UPI0037435471